jgi:hypothetical protein
VVVFEIVTVYSIFSVVPGSAFRSPSSLIIAAVLVAVTTGTNTAGAGAGTGALRKAWSTVVVVLLGESCALVSEALRVRSARRGEPAATGTKGVMIKSHESREALNILRPLE